MTRVIIRGCNGRMGKMITEQLKSSDTCEIAAGIDRFDDKTNSYPVFAEFSECNAAADVIIDFASPQGVEEMLEYAVAANVGIVLCTTGLSEEQIRSINETSKKIPILRSANMSLGINLLMQLLQAATKVLERADFDIEIVERHHNQKLDAPSGTALALADAIKGVLSNETSYCYDRSDRREKRRKDEIGISAVRGGTIVGEHEVIFAGRDEVIEFKHTAYSRAVFANGAISAAKFLAGKAPGMYSMADVVL